MTGPGKERILRHFEKQAASCDRLGSPFTARVCRAVPRILDESTETGERIWNWPSDPGPDALALRICGGLRALVLDGADPRLGDAYPRNEATDPQLEKALSGAVSRHDRRLARSLDSPPQTNEIARSAMLLPGFLAIARETRLPLALAEIGSSAGLNLLFDRFSYCYSREIWGDAASPVRLAPRVIGAPPPLAGELRITSRTGSDIAPVDISDPAARLRLRSYIWPDQPERLQRLDSAIELAATNPFALEKADAADFVRTRLASHPDGKTFVLFHSIMWQYMPEATRDSMVKTVDAAGIQATRTSPVAWLRMEPIVISDPLATLSLTLWPGGETRKLALCDYHGRSIEWIA